MNFNILKLALLYYTFSDFGTYILKLTFAYFSIANKLSYCIVSILYTIFSNVTPITQLKELKQKNESFVNDLWSIYFVQSLLSRNFCIFCAFYSFESEHFSLFFPTQYRKSWALLCKNSYFIYWNFDEKSCFVVFFHEWIEWKNMLIISSKFSVYKITIFTQN